MIRAGVGFSTAPNPRSAAAEATAAALAQAGLSRANGALCFATPAYGAAYPMILRTVASQAHTREVAGCSSMGVIAGETEIESGNALSVMVFGGEEIHATRFFVPTLRGRPAGVAADVASAVRSQLGKSNLLILFADTYNFEAEATLAALGTELPGVMIVGGGASEDGSIGETFVFAATRSARTRSPGCCFPETSSRPWRLAGMQADWTDASRDRGPRQHPDRTRRPSGLPGLRRDRRPPGRRPSPRARFVFVGIPVDENASRSSADDLSCATSSARARNMG